VLAALRYGRIGRADVDACVTKIESGLTGAEAAARRLPALVHDELLGHRSLSIEEYRAELRAVTPADVAAAAAEAHATSLLMVPPGRSPDWAGFAAAPSHSDAPVDGHRHPFRGNRSQVLVLGPEGVSLDDGDSPVTVRYAATAAMLAWPDGARRLIGHDAISVHVEPGLFAVDAAAMAAVDAAVPPELRVDMPARAPDDIPVPPSRGLLARRRAGLALRRALHRTADRIESVPDSLRWPVMIALFLLNVRLITVFSDDTAVRVSVFAVIFLLSLLLTDWAVSGLRRLGNRLGYYLAR
jgi:zinc protease